MIARAVATMDTTSDNEADNEIFIGDLLCIEICGPKCPHLDVVEMLDIDTAHEYGLKNLSSTKTVTLSIFSPKDIPETAVGVEISAVNKDSDLAVITLENLQRPLTLNEIRWLDIAVDKRIYFGYGYHICNKRCECQIVYL